MLLAADGSEVDADWAFTSRDQSIATVDIAGTISGLSAGQTWVDGIANSNFKDSVLVTVVSDPNEIASIMI